MTACAHRWLTASGERRDSCGECGVFATEVLVTLTQRLAATEGERERMSVNAANWSDACIEARAEALAQRQRADHAEADLKRMRGALDIEGFRQYHDLSFLDPPSYHEPDVTDLWDCPQCVERHMERAKAALIESAS